MQRQCVECATVFDFTSADEEFLKLVAPKWDGLIVPIPPPQTCPTCRHRRRLAFRNERFLYRRSCAHSGASILSVHSPESGVPVIDNAYWWSDAWDPLASGADYDFSRPFFVQLKEIYNRTPSINLLNTQCENSKYTHLSSYNKDCYFLFCGGHNRNCAYCLRTDFSTDCYDCDHIRRCELCFELSDCEDCTNVHHASDSRGCSESWFLSDCSNCQHCVGCVGLRNQSFYWLNQPLSEELFQAQLRTLETDLRFRNDLREKFRTLCASTPEPWSRQRLCEEVTGDYLVESKNCHDCFEAIQCEDCRYCQSILNTKSSQDVTHFGRSGELLYQCNNVGINSYHVLFCSYAYSSEIFYCYNVHYSKECFGCVNLHHAKYCILNKQYRPQEYYALLRRIIDHMRSTGEWGEFFPAWFSPFAYNETVAQEHFPCSEAQAASLGYRWHRDEVNLSHDIHPANYIAGGDEEFPSNWDSCASDTLSCLESGKKFKLIRPEIDFYRTHHLPLPRLHPDIRQFKRSTRRRPRNLKQRSCARCSRDLLTAATSPLVVCQGCYQSLTY